MAQGTILETWDRIPRQAPGAWSLLLPVPVSLPLSLSVSLMNKWIKILKKKTLNYTHGSEEMCYIFIGWLCSR